MSDRLSALRVNAEMLTGVDFIQVVDKCDQRVLRVYFFTDVAVLRPPFEAVSDPSIVPTPIQANAIRIYTPRDQAPDVILDDAAAGQLEWFEDTDFCRYYLQLIVKEPGTFTDYRLKINDSRIDSYYNDISFSFKVGCYDNLDCAKPEEKKYRAELADFPVDYLARDFVSLRNALLDFSAQRYPSWQLPREADVGVMFMEVMASLGDELSYVQDRLNREAYLETATERRTLRRKARLMDYEIHDGRMATTLLEFTVKDGTTEILAGSTSPVWALSVGAEPQVFEIGTDIGDNTHYLVNAKWNAANLVAYQFDDEPELAAGACGIHVINDLTNPSFTALEAAQWGDGRLLLLRDGVSDAADAERLHLVRVTSVELTSDSLFGVDLAHIQWSESDALPVAMRFEDLTLSGNLLPACAGERRKVSFRLGDLLPTDDESVLRSVEREGPLYSSSDPSLLERFNPCDDSGKGAGSKRNAIYLCSLPLSDERVLAFADPDGDIRSTKPELIVYPDGDESDPWSFQRNLLLCDGDAQVFTLEDGIWGPVVGYWQGEKEFVHQDYALGIGYTIRFGDGQFGRLPPRGALFHVEYRLGSGTIANLPAGAISALSVPNQDPPHIGPLEASIISVRNPFSINNGENPESSEQIRQLTPEAWRASSLFALRPEDYGQQSETLEFIQRAQGSFRWTGSWLSAYTSIDPVDSFQLSSQRRLTVETLLNCRRQAGRDVIVADPRYVNLDLEISVCVKRNAFPAQVQVRIMEALFGSTSNRHQAGFFDPDNFTFGSSLRRGALEATIASVEGVEAVIAMSYRIHGATDFAPFDMLELDVATDELIRLENSPLYPERGSLGLSMIGGA